MTYVVLHWIMAARTNVMKFTKTMFSSNRFILDYGRLIAVAVILVGVGSGALINQYIHTKKTDESKAVSTTVPQQHLSPTKTNQQAQAQPDQSTPTVSAPSSTLGSSTAYSAPKPVDNSAECNSIIAQANSDLTNLNTQIVAQLQIEKSIIGNSSIDSEILSRGGSVNQTVGQGGITESFNQADATANTLIDQFSTDASNYQDQLIGLDNGSSPGCAVMILPLH